jgi:hypothetical protein
MKITKSILCLWAGNAAFACFALYALAFHTGMACVMKNIGPGLDAGLSGGYHFVLADPEVRFFGVALACGILAATSLLVSWLRNKQPFFSLPRRLPKVTVTRVWVSLCQKGVTRWLLFLVNCLLAPKRVKTSRGASFEPWLAPPCGRRFVRLPTLVLGGGAKICGFSAFNEGVLGA